MFSIVRLIKHDGAGPLRAFCDVAVGPHLLIKGIRVIKGRGGLFVSMPRQLSKNGRWYDAVVLRTKESRDRFIELVLDAVEQQLSAPTPCEANTESADVQRA